MVWLKSTLDEFQKEISGMLMNDLDKKKLNLIFEEIRSYINSRYVSKEVMLNCVNAREKFCEENKLLRKKVSGYDKFITDLGLKTLKIEEKGNKNDSRMAIEA
jgi:hypothetical protein